MAGVQGVQSPSSMDPARLPVDVVAIPVAPAQAEAGGTVLGPPLDALGPEEAEPPGPSAQPDPAKQALAHPTRQFLYTIICENWGICEADLGKLTGLGRNNVKYHLRQLARAHLVYANASGRRVHYFPRKAESEYLREALCTLQSPSRREILELVMRRPDLSLRAVSREVGVTPRAVRWHIRQLAEAGLIGVHKQGIGIRSEIAVSDVLREALGFQDRRGQDPEAGL